MRIIGGVWSGRRIEAPRGRRVRPTADRVREAWMSALGGSLQGLRVLDLFAGSGALGLECLSRGAEEVVFVERSRRSIEVLERNVAALGAGERSSVVRADALKYVARLGGGAFDVALADPPYGEGLESTLLEAFAATPFAGELWVEHRTGAALPAVGGLTQRRYGDTTLTTIEAGAA